MSSYDFPYLADGLKLVIVGLGIFAVPEIIALLRKDKAISDKSSLGAGWLEGIKDWWQNRWLSARCAIIGVIVGVIPGLGGSVVDWIAYGHTVQTTRINQNSVPAIYAVLLGLRAPITPRRAADLCLPYYLAFRALALWLSLSGHYLCLARASLKLGQVMLKDNLNYTYAIVWLLALANIFGTILCIALSGQIAKITTIRFVLIAPFVL